VKNLEAVEKNLCEGEHPLNIGYKPTNLGNDFYYIRKSDARIIVKLDPTTGNSEIIAFALRSNPKNMETLATDFLDQFNVSTQKQANIKKLIVESFHQLQHDNRIKNKVKLVTKSEKVQETNKLVPLKIGQSKSIRFYEVL